MCIVRVNPAVLNNSVKQGMKSSAEMRIVMEKDMLYMQEVANGYRPDVERLIRYIPWLESKAGGDITKFYQENGIKDHSISFPVYDMQSGHS